MPHIHEQKNFRTCSLAAFRTVMDAHKKGSNVSRVYSIARKLTNRSERCDVHLLRRGTSRELRSVTIAALHALESIFIYLYYVYPYYVHAHTFTGVYATFLLEL